MNEIQNKKGQVGLEGLIGGFVIVSAVLFLIVMLVFTFGIFSTSMETTALSNTVVNESGHINATGYQLANGVSGVPRTFSIVTAFNGSDLTQDISSGNYTISSSGIISNATAYEWGTANMTYTYKNDSSEIVASKTAQENTSRAVPLIGILFIILSIGALIVILIVSLLGRKRV